MLGSYFRATERIRNGDFFKTMDIATRCGQDSDCNPATAAGILGVIQGYKAIPEYWKPALERCENIKFPYTDISLSSVYDINLKLLSDVLKANGGKIKGDKYYTTIQKPKTVAIAGYEFGRTVSTHGSR